MFAAAAAIWEGLRHFNKWEIFNLWWAKYGRSMFFFVSPSAFQTESKGKMIQMSAGRHLTTNFQRALINFPNLACLLCSLRSGCELVACLALNPSALSFFVCLWRVLSQNKQAPLQNETRLERILIFAWD
jgi:hypothetical protein